MAFSPDERAELRAVIGKKFPRSSDAGERFFTCIEEAVVSYELMAAYIGSVAGSEKEFEAGCRKVAKHADALLRLLDGGGSFPRLIALELSATPLRRFGSPVGQAKYIRQRAKIREATLDHLRESLVKLNVAANRGLALSGSWGKKRGRGRPPGLSDVQIKLAVECCRALQSIDVQPTLSESKRERWVKDQAAEYPALLRWSLKRAARRTESGRTVIGDVNRIALEGLQMYEASVKNALT